MTRTDILEGLATLCLIISLPAVATFMCMSSRGFDEPYSSTELVTFFSVIATPVVLVFWAIFFTFAPLLAGLLLPVWIIFSTGIADRLGII